MEKVIIIAEAGVNHNGDMNLAKKLIDVAAEAGVDYIKFQTFKTENLVSRHAEKAKYQIENTNDATQNQLQMLKRLELSEAQHFELFDYCKQKNISFFSTAFDLDSLYFLKKLGLSLVKVPSGELTNLPYLRVAAKLFKEVIISSGMSTMNEIRQAIEIFVQEGISKDSITILHCNTEYPTPLRDVNLKAMLAIQNYFGVKVGYSDHTLGIEVPIAAVALGGIMIEKHITLDRRLPGPDQLASLEPYELKNMVLAIRNIELAISGSGIKEPSESEKKNIEIARKSIVAKKNISKGEFFTELNITTKRPGTGISPMRWDEVLGRIATQDFNEDDLIII